MKFHSNIEIVEAAQWFPGGNHQQVEEHQYTGADNTLHVTGALVTPPDDNQETGVIHVDAGDWIVNSSLGHVFVLTNHEFKKHYTIMQERKDTKSQPDPTMGEVDSGFIKYLNLVADQINKTAVEHGWWETDRNNGEMIALMHCFSEDTDVLSDKGWMSIKDIVESKYDGKIATLNLITNLVEYHEALNFFKYQYKGKMFSLGGKHMKIDLLVTPNHNILNAYQNSRHWRFTKAKDLVRCIKIRRDFNYVDGSNEEWFILPSILKYRNNGESYKVPEVKIKMDDWLNFFGFWLADGCTFNNKNYVTNIVSIKQTKQKNFDFIRQSIANCGFHFTETKNGDFLISNRQLYEYLIKFGKSGDKYIPVELKRLSIRQLTILFDALILGDGHRRSHGYVDYNTKSTKLRDDVQEIGLKIGNSATYTICQKLNYDNVYKIGFSKHMKYPRQNCKSDTRKYVDYDGFVYCVEVPNSILFIRRNGKTCWCGNSELSEALEELRHGNPPSKKIPKFSGAEEEFADVIIRILDTAKVRNYDLAGAVLAKMKYNDTRPYKHGGKKF